MLPCYAWLPGGGSVVAAPTVSAISKTLGLTRGGQAITITGTNFTTATSAAVGGVNITSFVVVNATTITGVTAAKSASTNNTVTVTNPGGTGTLTNAYEYWTPLTVSAAALWYDVGVSTVTSGKLTALPDQSGNSRNATLVNGGTGLVVTAANSGYGNLPTVHRTDSTDSITSPSVGITTGARTVVFVGDAPTASFNYLMKSTLGGLDLRAQSAVFRGSDDGGATELNSGTVTVTSPNVVICAFNGASSRIYGTAATSVAGSTGTLADLTGAGFMVGDSAAGGGGDLNFAHALVYSGALSDANCKELLRGFGLLTGISIGA